MVSLVALVIGIAVVPAPCPWQAHSNSCYVPAQRAIYIAPEHANNRDILMHEYGHAWDYERLTDTDRRRFQRLMGYPSRLGWWQEPRYRKSPGEAFADAYADCALGTSRRISRLCSLLPRRSVSRAAGAALVPRWQPSP